MNYRVLKADQNTCLLINLLQVNIDWITRKNAEGCSSARVIIEDAIAIPVEAQPQIACRREIGCGIDKAIVARTGRRKGDTDITC